MKHSSSQSDPRPDETQIVFSTSDHWSAEYIQLLLLALDIRAVIRQRDPFALGQVVCEVVVMAVDCVKAHQAIEESRSRSTGEWQCQECHEVVPDNFDICWNCEALHPDLAADAAIEIDEPEQIADRVRVVPPGL